MTKDTVSIAFASAAIARLDVCARVRILDEVGIPQEWLVEPRSRVPAQVFSALWLSVAHEMDDEFFGLDRRRMKVGSFALLCQSVMNLDTLDRALRRMLRGLRLFLDDVKPSVLLEGSNAAITIENRIADPDARCFADETLLVMIHGLMCWLVGRRIPLLAAEFAYPRPSYATEYTTLFSDYTRFDAVATSVRFDAKFLLLRPIQNSATLKAFLNGAPRSVFLKYRNERGWAAKVRGRMRRTLGRSSLPALDELALEFHVSATTLRRRLEAEGTNIKEIRDQVRCDIAIDRLRNTKLSTADIALLLGFPEPSAFYRAFKRWTGVRPGEYRPRP